MGGKWQRVLRYFIFICECLVKLKQWNAWLWYVTHEYMKREKRSKYLAYQAKLPHIVGAELSGVTVSWDIKVL